MPSDNREISRGQTQHCPCVDAGLITHTPMRMGDFAVTCPLVPGGPTPPIRFLYVAPHLWIGLPPAFGTPSRDDALALLLAFGSANTWRGDSHPARSVSCLAFDMSGSLQQAVRSMEWLN